jgi:hypothetical protein
MKLFFLCIIFYLDILNSQQLFTQLNKIYDEISEIFKINMNTFDYFESMLLFEKPNMDDKKHGEILKKNINTLGDENKFTLEQRNSNEKKIRKEFKRNLLEQHKNKTSNICNGVGYLAHIYIDTYFCDGIEVEKQYFDSI